jgi:hypothetical protein
MNKTQLHMLKEALADWVGLWEVVRITGEDPDMNGDELRIAVLTSVRELLDGGLIMAGDLGSTAFTPWNITPEMAVSRIESEWLQLRGESNIGDICWFANTADGSELAQQLIRSDEVARLQRFADA